VIFIVDKANDSLKPRFDHFWFDWLAPVYREVGRQRQYELLISHQVRQTAPIAAKTGTD